MVRRGLFGKIHGHLTVRPRANTNKLLCLLILFCYYMDFVSSTLLLYRSKNAWGCIVRSREMKICVTRANCY